MGSPLDSLLEMKRRIRFEVWFFLFSIQSSAWYALSFMPFRFWPYSVGCALGCDNCRLSQWREDYINDFEFKSNFGDEAWDHFFRATCFGDIIKLSKFTLTVYFLFFESHIFLFNNFSAMYLYIILHKTPQKCLIFTDILSTSITTLHIHFCKNRKLFK